MCRGNLKLSCFNLNFIVFVQCDIKSCLTSTKTKLATVNTRVLHHGVRSFASTPVMYSPPLTSDEEEQRRPPMAKRSNIFRVRSRATRDSLTNSSGTDVVL